MAITSVFPTQGFQNFIDESINVLSATTGTPGIGQFRSSIVGRAPITDIANNLKPSFGIERIQTQQIVQLQNEFGPNGEPVWSAVNDDKGMIRFVGGWTSYVNNSGQYTYSPNVNDYVEITFYGTALNLLTTSLTGSRDVRVSVDGGAEGSNVYTNGSSILIGRNYSCNCVANATSGLALGIHTAKIRVNSGGVDVFGFEIIGNISAIATNPGSAFVQGRRSALATQDIQAATSGFTNTYGSAGTKGGRVLHYLASDNTVKKDIQYVDASSNFLTSADHSNEEIARVYHWREFGANRTDDFSLVYTQVSNLAFTLDDGTTNLMGSGVASSVNAAGIGINNNGGYLIFTFVGTGLDIQTFDIAAGGSDTYTFQIDNGTATAWPNTAGNTAIRNLKIVSGLPYGTHTFRINRITATVWVPEVITFKVYQPKKPALPAGAIELADYNILANYVQTANSLAGNSATSMPIGTIRKMEMREAVYSGTFSATGFSNVHDSGQNMYSSTSGSYQEVTFFGTGFEFAGFVNTTAANFAVTVDGVASQSAYTTFFQQSASGLTYTPSTGIISGTPAAGFIRLGVSGLPLGPHKFRITNNSSNGLDFGAFDVITPIYSAKSNLNYGAQNTLSVGSNALSDNRKTSAIKEAYLQKKNISQSFAYMSSSTTSTVAVPLPGMAVTHTNTTGRVKITYRIQTSSTVSGGYVVLGVNVDGVGVTPYEGIQNATGYGTLNVDCIVVNVSPGTHSYQMYWASGSGTVSAGNGTGTFIVEEV